MSKVNLRIGCAEVVSLAFATGKPVTSDYTGDEMLYTCEDGRSLYAPLPLADAIEAAGIGAKQPFEVIKRSSKTYQVRLVKPEGESRAAGRIQPNAVGVTSGTTPKNIPLQGSEHFDSNAVSRAAAKPMKSAGSPMGKILMASLYIAIDATKEAEAYADRCGLSIQFTEESVRAMAITCFIQASKGGF